MKKKHITLIIIAILILATIGSLFIYNMIQENNKEYEIEQISQYNYFVLKQNDLYGVIDKNGNTIIPTQYNEVQIPNPEKEVFVCTKDESTRILNGKREEILTQYNQVMPIRLKNIASDLMYEKSVLRYEKDGKYGLIKFDGEEVTKPIYDEIDSMPYKEGTLVVKQNNKYGVINIKGKEVVEIAYDQITIDEYYTNDQQYRQSGYIVSLKTEEGYRYGYINNKGKKVLEVEYNEISRVIDIQDEEDIFLICAKNGQYGINKNEETILGNEYQSIRYDSTNKVFVVEKSKKYGIINVEGKEIVPVEYNQIDITGIYLYAQNEQGITVYNSNGTQANINSNVAILNTSNEKYKIRINNENGTKYGVINKEGKQLIEEKYNYIEYLYDNYFIVSNQNGKLGVIDDKGNIKIEIDKDSIQKIQNTDLIQATVTENKMTEIYSKAIEKVSELENAVVEIIDNNIKIYNESEIKYLNQQGKEVKNIDIYPDNKLFVNKQNEKYGFIDKNEELIVDYKYDKAYEFNQYGFASIKKDGKWGAINEQGQEVIAPIYEIKGQNEPSFIGKYYKVTYGFGEFYYTDAK